MPKGWLLILRLMISYSGGGVGSQGRPGPIDFTPIADCSVNPKYKCQ